MEKFRLGRRRVDPILTSAVVPNVRLRAQATFLRIANGIPRAIAVDLASDYTDALDVRIRIRDSSFWAGTRVRTFGVGATSAMAAGV